jgi:hypothetical protein
VCHSRSCDLTELCRAISHVVLVSWFTFDGCHQLCLEVDAGLEGSRQGPSLAPSGSCRSGEHLDFSFSYYGRGEWATFVETRLGRDACSALSMTALGPTLGGCI